MENVIKKNGKTYCASCGKKQTDLEVMCGQCNDCDPFEDADMLEELFGESEYIEV